jgi:hypothetical protein
LYVFFTIVKRPRYEVVHGGFGVPAVEDIPFIRGARSRAYYLACLFYEGEVAGQARLPGI